MVTPWWKSNKKYATLFHSEVNTLKIDTTIFVTGQNIHSGDL